MKQHHARSHGRSLSKSDYECDWCGETVRRKDSAVQDLVFCDNDCKFDFLHEHRRGRQRHEVECSNCGADLERTPYDYEQADNFFCNRECKTEWMGGEDHHWWEGGNVTVECCVCGDEKEVSPSRAESEDRHFCYEKGCRYEWISENHSGEDHEHWKGGHSYAYGHTWEEQREKALERDGYECRACGMSQEEHEERVGNGLEVHHVVPLREFDDPNDGNSLGNLVTACKWCHIKYEGVPVFPK